MLSVLLPVVILLGAGMTFLGVMLDKARADVRTIRKEMLIETRHCHERMDEFVEDRDAWRRQDFETMEHRYRDQLDARSASAQRATEALAEVLQTEKARARLAAAEARAGR